MTCLFIGLFLLRAQALQCMPLNWVMPIIALNFLIDQSLLICWFAIDIFTSLHVQYENGTEEITVTRENTQGYAG